jgi:hypothetical protein
MNNSFFYTEVQVLKLDIGYTNHLKNTYELLSSRHQFVGLDENTIDDDYPNYKIYL